MDDLEDRAREFKVFDLSEFYLSHVFKENNFEAILDQRIVRRRF